jgi:uncharacterized protein Yka (UPF0111/DUF47 family)
VGSVTRRWFLPETPDVLGMLRTQMDVTVEGMDALARWAGGEEAQERAVRDAEHQADEAKLALRAMLRTAFVTPIDPEELFEISVGLDGILNNAKDLVREAEVMAMGPDPAMLEMAALLAQGVGHLRDALQHLGEDDDRATAAADAAVKSQRRLERVYRKASSALLELEDVHEVMGRRELYRRLSRIADLLSTVAERLWYSVMKQA